MEKEARTKKKPAVKKKSSKKGQDSSESQVCKTSSFIQLRWKLKLFLVSLEFKTQK